MAENESIGRFSELVQAHTRYQDAFLVLSRLVRDVAPLVLLEAGPLEDGIWLRLLQRVEACEHTASALELALRRVVTSDAAS